MDPLPSRLRAIRDGRKRDKPEPICHILFISASFIFVKIICLKRPEIRPLRAAMEAR